MFDHMLESSHRDDSNKWSNIGFDEETTQLVLIEVNLMYLIWSSEHFAEQNFIDEMSQNHSFKNIPENLTITTPN